jgi:hypothetical protein
MFFDAAFAVRQIVGCPVVLDSETAQAALALVAAVCHQLESIAERMRKAALPDSVERKLLGEASLWHERVTARIAQDAASLTGQKEDDDAFVAAAGGPLFVTLDDAAILGMMEWLPPRDIGTLSLTCRRLSVLGINDLLWKAIASWWFSSPVPSPPDGITYRELVIQDYVKGKGELWVGGSGLWRCTACDTFFWSARNRPGSCTSKWSAVPHNGIPVHPEAIAQTVLTRKVAVVSDVLYF